MLSKRPWQDTATRKCQTIEFEICPLDMVTFCKFSSHICDLKVRLEESHFWEANQNIICAVEIQLWICICEFCSRCYLPLVCLNLPAAFSQPENSLIVEPCKAILSSPSETTNIRWTTIVMGIWECTFASCNCKFSTVCLLSRKKFCCATQSRQGNKITSMT